MTSNIKIATAPCSWGVWYPDGTPSGTPYATFLNQAREAGYKALELGPDGYLPTDTGLLRAELEQRQLEICAGTACYAFDQYKDFNGFKDQVDSLCKRLSQFQAKYLVTMDESDVGVFSEKKEQFLPAAWTKYFQMFKDMGRYTKQEYGIETVFHPHIKSLVETEAEICRMMSYSDLSLCLDIGHHAYVNGDSTLEFIKSHADKISYLHFKNVNEEVFKLIIKEHLNSDTAFDIDVMGDLESGMVDYAALKKILDAIAFDGIGVIEQDMPRASTQQAFAAAKRNLDYLKTIHMIV